MSGMISPFAGSFRGSGKFRNVSPFRARGRATGQWNPAYSVPYAWYDSALASDATGLTDQSTYSSAAMTVGASAAAPIWLAYTTPRIVFPGVLGNSVSTPGTGTLDIVGDIDIRLRLSMDDWTPAAQSTLISKWSGGIPGSAYRLSVGVGGNLGKLITTWYNALNSATSAVSTVAVGATDGDIADIRWVLDVDNGATGSDATFYAPSSSRLGTTVTNSGIADIQSNATAIKIGERDSEPLAGSLYSASIRAGIDGTIVTAFDPALSGPSGYTDAYGKVWTVNHSASGRKAVVQSPTAGTAHPLYLLATDDKFDGPTAAIPPCDNAASASMFAVIRPWATQASPKVIFTTRSGSGAGVTLRMASATTIVADVSDGTTTNTTGAVTFTPGQRLVTGVHLGSGGTAWVSVNNTTGTTVARPSGTQAGGVLVVGADSTPANYLDAECRVPWYALDHLATATEIANLTAFYGGGL